MPIFDRYLTRLFLKVLLGCFFSLAGLYIVIDMFGNLDEFRGYGETQGGMLWVICDYYSARIPWFFNHASGLLALISAMFAVTWLQRSNELTALMAAGVSTRRIVRPLILGAIVVSGIAVANRELVIPAERDKLVRNAQDWLGENARKVSAVTDNRTDILINGRNCFAKDKRIADPTFTLHRKIGDYGRNLEAKNAFHQDAVDGHPGGYLLVGVTRPKDSAKLPSASLNGEPVILSPLDTPWLKPDQCFVVSAVNFHHLAGGSQWREYASTSELIAGLQNPSLDFGLRTRVMMHARFVQPMLDMCLFLLGLPLVLTKQNRNVFVAIGMCVGVVIGYFLLVMICQAMGSSGFVFSPAQAAWCPLVILAPTAAMVSFPIWE